MTLYEPEELVLSAKAGTPIAEIEALVASKGQQLAFEPMDYGPMLGGVADGGSLGGALAANLSGPRRIKAGAARDHFLGVTAVSGRGETFKSGGRVVKNVTGYDLCKLLAGSWGTLAAMTDVTIKVLPRPETEATVLVAGPRRCPRRAAMSAAMGSSCDVSAAAHLPRNMVMHFDGLYVDQAATALRLEGVAPSVKHRKDALTALMQPFGALEPSTKRIRGSFGAACATPRRSGPTARSATGRCGAFRPRRRAATSSQRSSRRGRSCSTIGPADCSGLRCRRRPMPAPPPSAAPRRRPAAMPPLFARRLPRARGRRVRAAEAALAGVSKRVKESFDPKGVLNPGRMWAGV